METTIEGLRLHSCRLPIDKPPPFTGLNIRIPIIIPVKGSGFIDQGSWLGLVALHE